MAVASFLVQTVSGIREVNEVQVEDESDFNVYASDAVNQMVEVVEAEVEQCVLEVVLKALHEVLLLLAVIRNLSRGVASKLQKAITILRDRHSPLK